MSQLSSVAAAWLGALFEGEGWLNCREPDSAEMRKWGGLGAAVLIGSTEVETVATCLRLTQAGVVMYSAATKRPEHHKAMWTWYLGRTNDVRSFLQQVLPYLTGKQEGAERIIRIIEETEHE